MAKFDLNKIHVPELPKSVSKWVINSKLGTENLTLSSITKGQSQHSRVGNSTEEQVSLKRSSLKNGWDYDYGKPVTNIVDEFGNVHKADGFTKTEAAIGLGWTEIPEWRIWLKPGAPVNQILHTIGMFMNAEQSPSSPSSDVDYINHLSKGVRNGWWQVDTDGFEDILSEIAPFMTNSRKQKLIGRAKSDLGVKAEYYQFTNARIDQIQQKLSIELDGITWNNIQVSNLNSKPHTPIKGISRKYFGAGLKKGYSERLYFQALKRFQQTGCNTYFVGVADKITSIDSVWTKRMNIITQLNDADKVLKKAGCLYTPCQLIGFLPQLETEPTDVLITVDSVKEYFGKHSARGLIST